MAQIVLDSLKRVLALSACLWSWCILALVSPLTPLSSFKVLSVVSITRYDEQQHWLALVCTHHLIGHKPKSLTMMSSQPNNDSKSCLHFADSLIRTATLWTKFKPSVIRLTSRATSWSREWLLQCTYSECGLASLSCASWTPDRWPDMLLPPSKQYPWRKQIGMLILINRSFTHLNSVSAVVSRHL